MDGKEARPTLRTFLDRPTTMEYQPIQYWPALFQPGIRSMIWTCRDRMGEATWSRASRRPDQVGTADMPTAKHFHCQFCAFNVKAADEEEVAEHVKMHKKTIIQMLTSARRTYGKERGMSRPQPRRGRAMGQNKHHMAAQAVDVYPLQNPRTDHYLKQ